VACLLIGFWVSLWFDWFWEPNRVVRLVVLAGILAVALGVFVRWGVVRLLRRISDRTLAVLLERQHRDFGESLITTVELAGALAPGSLAASMLERAAGKAAELAKRKDYRLLLDYNRLARRGIVVAVLFLGTAATGLLFPDVFAMWGRRYLGLSDQPWPRRVRLTVEGFVDGTVRVPRGDDFTLLVKADTRKEIPDRVSVIYRDAAGRRVREPMVREGIADPAKDRWQEYTYVFRALTHPVVLDVRGGDAVLNDLRIELVERPVIVDAKIRYAYPSYLRKEPETRPIEGLMSVFEGASVVLEGTVSKPIDSGIVSWKPSSETKDQKKTTPGFRRTSERTFEVRLGDLVSGGTLLIDLKDTDGVAMRQPYPVVFTVVPDLPPRLSVRTQGIGATITPVAVIPLTGTVSDDHGVARVSAGLAFSNDLEPVRTVLRSFDDLPGECRVDAEIAIEDYSLSPGDTITLTVEATDACDLHGTPNRTVSEPWTFRIVSAEELRNTLQAREMVLRQRFESHIADVERMRDQLVEAGSAPDALAKRLAVVRSRQDAGKSGHDVENIAEAFEDLYAELRHNRIDTSDDRRHLIEEIAEPLADISGKLYNIEEKLRTLEPSLESSAFAEELRQTIDETTQVLAAMNDVLGVMLKMEDYNEAIELLKDILETHQQIENATRQRHAEELRKLLEGEL
ncbi:MAG: hypothetical protein D6741_00480, partial [Planctomycetota bacterium]